MVEPCFLVGIYARISVDAGEEKRESINTQIAMCRQYLSEHPDMKLYHCYTDIGKSGVSFKRTGFEQMMEDIKQGRINCVLVKDLSRFGRNHIETGNYIQNIFPFLGVRFIALTDGVDTFLPESGTDEMIVSLKNLINEMYVRDIAQKISSSKRSCREEGGYTGGIPPYGYKTGWENGKRHLFVCPETGEIVKEIYRMYLSGKNRAQIAGILYERGVHRPDAYRKTGQAYGKEGELLQPWSSETVKRILTNPVYKDNVPGIISEEDFSRAADIAKVHAPKRKKRGKTVGVCKKREKLEESSVKREIARYGALIEGKRRWGSELYRQYRTGSLTCTEFQKKLRENEQAVGVLTTERLHLQNSLKDMKVEKENG